MTSPRPGPPPARARAGCRRGRGRCARSRPGRRHRRPFRAAPPGPVRRRAALPGTPAPGRLASPRAGVRGTDGHLHLVGDRQCLAAGGQDRHLGAPAQDLVDEAGGGVDDVLAVVDQQQELLRDQVGDDPLAYVMVTGCSVQRHPEGVGHGQWHLVGVSTEARRTPKAPSGNAVGGRTRRQPAPRGLAGAAGADERQQAEPRPARPGSRAGRHGRSAGAPPSAGSSPRCGRASRGCGTPPERRHVGLRTERLVLAQHAFVQRAQRQRRLEAQGLVQEESPP